MVFFLDAVQTHYVGSVFVGDNILRAKAAAERGNRCGWGILLVCLLALPVDCWSQKPNSAGNATAPADRNSEGGSDSLARFVGLPIRSIGFQGVAVSRLNPLAAQLAEEQGKALSREFLKGSLRQLYETGLFDGIDVAGSSEQGGVALVFRGTPRSFIGTVSVDGAKGATINTQLERASQLTPGTRFTEAKLSQALELMRKAEAENGFPDPVITHTLTPHPEEQLVDIAFRVVSGPQARVGAVDVTGDPGMSSDDFRHYAHLKPGSRVNHDTGNRALTGVLKHYQGQDRLEAEIKIESRQYVKETKKANFHFSATRGPVVKVMVEGVGLASSRIKRIIPIFEEGTVDEDLLNEGNRRLRDYFQRRGYFDVKVDHSQQAPNADQLLILYTVHLGSRRRVEKVSVEGNHYFDSATLKELLSVHAADALDHQGAYSQALVAADMSALQAVYRNNGFSHVKIAPETNTPEARTMDTKAADAQQPEAKANLAGSGKIDPLIVVYRIEEGSQQRVGSVLLEGNAHVDAASLTTQMNTLAGQLLSPQNLAGDRDTLLTDYLSRGFDQARVEVTPQVEPGDSSKVDVVFHITEGQQIFVRKVLLTGLHYTRPDTIAKAITLHPGDPLNQTALRETQRNLYEFALFNEVEAAIENPTGGETQKTILLQTIEARRWALTYGFGFEAQTGTPQNNCRGAIAGGVPCNPNGKTGVSPRVLADITRNNLFGRERSASLRGTYGLLEQRVDLLFQNPHFEGNRNFGLTFSGGYANSQDVTTYVASRLQAGARLTESFLNPGSFLPKANTLVYEYNFRRVKVAASSLQVYPDAISLLSTAVRMAGPGFTWIRDTRDSPLDARRGTYTSFQEFLSGRPFGSEAQFNRMDMSNSSFYSFNKGRFVLARNTRYGQERAFGPTTDKLIPLPERLYAGGPTSLRGFSVNAAGPRDPQTGFPIGGAGALINSTELRLPPPTLPWLGDTVSFVLFHDMGNIFTNASDAWPSALRVHQPDQEACKDPIPATTPPKPPTGPSTSTGVQGACSFNYFSHAPGLGMRYHTPVGPIRFDFSYNLNPPIYPVTYDYANPTFAPHVGEAGHFNFFFSLGQTF
jgi:outer membrane protein assembly complex protein YaeT